MAFRALILGLALLPPWPVGQPPIPPGTAPLPRYGTFIFSDLCILPQSGKLTGSRLKLVRSDRQDIVYYEWGMRGFEPGGFAHMQDKPFGKKVGAGRYAATAISNQIDSYGRLKASFSSDQYAFRFVLGLLRNEGFVLSGYESAVTWLPRQHDLSAKMQTCRAPQSPPWK